MGMFFALFGCGPSSNEGDGAGEKHNLTYDPGQIRTELETALKEKLLHAWYPRCMDTVNGGFISSFSYDWIPQGNQNKFIVSQARQVWTACKAAELYPEDPRYRKAADHGFAWLRDVMWDKEYGGFVELTDPQGNFTENGREKRAYGNSFGIYALAAYAKLTKTEEAVNFARDAFLWLDDHAHDSIYGGYFQFLKEDGTPYPSTQIGNSGDSGIPAENYKDQNSSIHLLEAFTELYPVWPEERLKKRLHEMLLIVRDTITRDFGSLTLFLYPDWRPVDFSDSSRQFIDDNIRTDHVSFGHDIETGFLMVEAAEALGMGQDSMTVYKGKKMVDHTIKNGWDNENGGIFDGGYYYKGSKNIEVNLRAKDWWPQSEALNALLLYSILFPDEYYMEYYLKEWEYVNAYFIDHEHGGWYSHGTDYNPEANREPKANIWKTSYHTARALMNSLRWLD